MQIANTWCAFLLVAVLPACTDAARHYDGDGELTDNGPLAAKNRYVLGLGTVEQGQSSYRLAGLPEDRFTVGLTVQTSLRSQSLCADQTLSNRVSVKLTTAAGKMVIDESAPLDEWVWSRRVDICEHEAFVFRVGRTKEVDAGDGFTRFEGLGIKAHEGWGTYFSPSRDTEYRLQVTLHEPMPEGFSAKLQAVGGGWK